MKLKIALLIAALLSPTLAEEHPIRIWTQHATGKQVAARFVSYDKESRTLRIATKENKEFVIPLESLTPVDQDFVVELTTVIPPPVEVVKEIDLGSSRGKAVEILVRAQKRPMVAKIYGMKPNKSLVATAISRDGKDKLWVGTVWQNYRIELEDEFKNVVYVIDNSIKD